MERAQSGDAHAFADLVRLYQRRAVSVAYRLVSHAEDARDVAQDAFVRAYRNLGQLDDPARFGSWLMRVVTTQALNFRRARSTRATASLDDTVEAIGGAVSPSTGRPMVTTGDVGAEDAPDELHAAIDAAIATLPEKQRLCLILFSVEGMPQAQVAEILDCTVELVKWNVFTARKKLKELLVDHL